MCGENGGTCQYGCLWLLTPVLIVPSCRDSSLSSYQETQDPSFSFSELNLLCW